MGTKYTVSTFPIGDKVSNLDPSYPELRKQKGNEVDGDRGQLFRLVEATNADLLTGQAKVYKYTDPLLYTVELAGATDPAAGIGILDQQSLALVGDLFWVQIAGRATLTDSGSGIAAGDLLDAAATGDVVTQATPVLGQTLARAAEAAVADAQLQADLLMKLVG